MHGMVCTTMHCTSRLCKSFQLSQARGCVRSTESQEGPRSSKIYFAARRISDGGCATGALPGLLPEPIGVFRRFLEETLAELNSLWRSHGSGILLDGRTL